MDASVLFVTNGSSKTLDALDTPMAMVAARRKGVTGVAGRSVAVCGLSSSIVSVSVLRSGDMASLETVGEEAVRRGFLVRSGEVIAMWAYITCTSNVIAKDIGKRYL